MQNHAYLFNNVVFKTTHGFGSQGDRSLLIEDAPNDRRAENIAFHAGANDYFVALATVINSMIEDAHCGRTISTQQLEDLRDELLYLQAHYRLQRKKII